MEDDKFWSLVKEYTEFELDQGDFVCLKRWGKGFEVNEHLLTFSGIEIIRKIPRYGIPFSVFYQDDEYEYEEE